MIRAFALSIVAVAVAFASPNARAEHHEAGEAHAHEAHADEAASPEAAPTPTPWDQAKVVELARALQQGAHELREMERAQPPGNLADGQSSVRMRYLDKLRLATSEARRLADNVEKGKGRDDTIQNFRRLNELLRDAAEEARRMFLPQATLDKIEVLDPQADELALFYTGKAEPRPALHGPTKD